VRKGSGNIYFWVTWQDLFYTFTHGSSQVKLNCLVSDTKIENTWIILSEISVEILLCAGNILVLLELARSLMA